MRTAHRGLLENLISRASRQSRILETSSSLPFPHLEYFTPSNKEEKAVILLNKQLFLRSQEWHCWKLSVAMMLISLFLIISFSERFLSFLPASIQTALKAY